jgi:SAM-dependent methyltransferase
MGSQAMQATLWGRKPLDWASIQEQTSLPGYDFVLQKLNLSPADTLLDVGCGSGFFCSLAAASGATITGFDGTEPLILAARDRAPDITFLTGDMEALPFPDASFDIVTGFNSFQYAASIPKALAEALRVLKPGGRFVTMIWGNKEDCQAAVSLGAIGKLLPPPPPGAPGPFTLSENRKLEDLLTEVGFHVTNSTDVPTIWDYPDIEIGMKGILASGPAIRAIDHCGYESVYAALLQSAQPFVQPNGHLVYANTNRVVMATA